MFACVKGDVYPIEPSDGFTVKQVLDAHWGVLNDEDVRWFIIAYCPLLYLFFLFACNAL